MTLLEQLERSFGAAAQEMTEHAKQLAELARIRAAIAMENRAQDRIYAEMGEEVYRRERNDSASPLAEHCTKIGRSRANVEDLMRRAQDLQGYQDVQDVRDAEEESPAPPEAPEQSGLWQKNAADAAEELFRPEPTSPQE